MNSTARTWAGATAAIAALIVAAGCTTESQPLPGTSSTKMLPPSQSTTATPAAPVTSSIPDRFSDEVVGAAMGAVIESEGIPLPQSMHLEYARISCKAIGEGINPIAVASAAHDGMPQYSLMDHATLVGASVGAMCPQHSDKIGAF